MPALWFSKKSCGALCFAVRHNRPAGASGPERVRLPDCQLATMFLDVFAEVLMRFEAFLVGVGRDFTKLDKFSAWDDTSGGLGHRTDTG